jgi:plasmid stability protein
VAQILIRNLDSAVLDALRRRAGEHGSSVEEEARRALAASVGLTRDEALRRIDELRARIGRLPGPSSLEILRRIDCAMSLATTDDRHRRRRRRH